MGAALAIQALVLFERHTALLGQVPFFGASCALVFVHTDTTFAQPRGVISGHLISSGIRLATLAVLGTGPVALALDVRLAILAIMWTRATHPPVGGDSFIVILTSAKLLFLLEPMLINSVAVVLIGLAYHSVFAGDSYPRWRA